MEIKRASEASFEHGDDGRFTGSVWLNTGLSTAEGTGMVVVHFEPGGRTHWHQHSGGQLISCTAGRGRVASRGEPVYELAPGDVTYTPPGEWHWHGGGIDTPMVHVAVNLSGAPEWGDPVTDQEYRSGS